MTSLSSSSTTTTTTTTPAIIAISPSNTFLAVASSSTSANVSCYNLPSCNHAFTLQSPPTPPTSTSMFSNENLRVAKISLCGGNNHNPPTHIITQHVAPQEALNNYKIIKDDEDGGSSHSPSTISVWDVQTAQFSHVIRIPDHTVVHDICTSSPSPDVQQQQDDDSMSSSSNSSNSGENGLLFVLVYIPLKQKYQVLEYDIVTGNLRRKIRAGSGSGSSKSVPDSLLGQLICTYDGRYLAVKTPERNGQIRILNRLTGERIQKIALNDSYHHIRNNNSSQGDTSDNVNYNHDTILMRFSPSGKFLMVCHHDNIINVHTMMFPSNTLSPDHVHNNHSSSSSSKSKPKSKNVTLLLENQIRQQTSVVHMNMIDTKDHTLDALITCADGTVCLFDNVQFVNEEENVEKTSSDDNGTTTTTLTSTSIIQVRHPTYRNGTIGSRPHKLVEIGTTTEEERRNSKISVASFANKRQIFFIVMGGGKGTKSSTLESIRSYKMPFKDRNLKYKLQKEEWIPSTSGTDSFINGADEGDRSNTKRKIEGLSSKPSKILGPDKSVGECLMMKTMEDIEKERKSKKIKLDNDTSMTEEKEHLDENSDDEECIPIMLRCKNENKKENEKNTNRYASTSNDRLEAIRQYFFHVNPLPLPHFKSPDTRYKMSSEIEEYNETKDTLAMTTTTTPTTTRTDMEKVTQQIQSLHIGLDSTNIAERARTVSGLLIQAIQQAGPTHKFLCHTNNYPKKGIILPIYLSEYKPTMLERIITEMKDFTFISQVISSLQAHQELFPPLLEYILYLIQNYSDESELTGLMTRKLFAFWLKRILMEFMYTKEGKDVDTLNQVQKLVKDRLGNCKSLLLLKGRLAHLKGDFGEEMYG